MKENSIRKYIAQSFFVFWLVIMYMGADHPPPPGFILIIIFDIIAALLVYYRLSTYYEWQKTNKKYAIIFAWLDGIFAGLGVALITIIINPSGEPSVTPNIIDKLIWFVVLGIIGSFNSTVIFGMAKAFSKIMKTGKLENQND
jgi:hypothetical protein